jgi:PTS system N-acetylglucosamine-specific IIC component
MKHAFSRLQQLGRALMLPIAVLPIAGLLLRLGQPDLLALPMLAAAGNAVFSSLGLLFAIGVAVGLARENHGAAGLAAVVGYLVATKGAEVLIPVPPETVAGLAGQVRDLAAAAYKTRELAKLSVPAGIISGVLAGVLYNRYADIRLPSYLAFFGGRRFVPIASGCVGLVVAAAFGYGWPWLERGMDALSHAVLGAGEVGLFAYGVLNRALIITGLHHILNNLAWFLLGDYGGVTGDLNRFFAGDPAAGAFMSGFFPVMMFGLPAACLAMYHEALPERRRAAAGLLASMALTSFLTGVTEPIEFTFIFLAPLLYAIHAVLTGVAMVVMHVLGARLGFSFSAGLFDYVINFSRSTRPWLLLPVGLAYFAVYYGAFRFFIARFGLKTPGREDETAAGATEPVAVPTSDQASAMIAALGGPANLEAVDACTTRLRLTVANQGAVDEAALRRLGARGLVRPSSNTLQVVLGPIADQVAGELRAALRETRPAHRASSVAASSRSSTVSPSSADRRGGAADVDTGFIERLIAALGGRGNLDSVAAASTRLLVSLKDPAALDEATLRSLDLRGVARPAEDRLHLLIGPAAEDVRQALRNSAQSQTTSA